MRRRFFAALCIQCILSVMLLGGARVWQQGRNRTHREQVQLASLTVQADTAELEILGRSSIRMRLHSDSPLPLLAEALTDDCLQVWMWIFDKFTESS